MAIITETLELRISDLLWRLTVYMKDVFDRNNCLQDKNRKRGDDATNLSQENHI